MKTSNLSTDKEYKELIYTDEEFKRSIEKMEPVEGKFIKTGLFNGWVIHT